MNDRREDIVLDSIGYLFQYLESDVQYISINNIKNFI